MADDAAKTRHSLRNGRLPPIGFWSYSRQDDELSGGMLSRLRSLLMSEIQQQYGRERVQLFQDVSAIPHGAQWEHEIRNALGNSSFFIPIVTPNFIQSEWCATEVRVFLERERELLETYPQLPRRSLIFPLQLIDIGGVDPHDPDGLAALQERHWFDFRPFRHRSHDDEATRSALADFASSIRRVLQTKLQEAEAPSTPQAPEIVRTAAPPPQPASHDESNAGPDVFPVRRPKAMLWAALGGFALLVAVVAVVLLTMRGRIAQRGAQARRAAAETVEQNKAAPASSPLATAAGPGATVDPQTYAWVLGDWGYSNCSLLVHVTAAPAGITLTIGSGPPETVRVAWADQQSIETAPYHFQRDADGVGWFAGSNQIARLVPCPNGPATAGN